ncbi:MAG: hypothetical protein ACK53Y_27910, partial [bacterium]
LRKRIVTSDVRDSTQHGIESGDALEELLSADQNVAPCSTVLPFDLLSNNSTMYFLFRLVV